MDNSVLLPSRKEESEHSRAPNANSSETGMIRSQAPPHALRTLPSMLGNQSAQRVLAPLVIQPKLTIGAPDDVYEKEADAVAEQVMSVQTSFAAAGASASDDDHNDPRSLAGKAASQPSASQPSAQRSLLQRIPIRTLQQTLGNRAFARLLQKTFPAPAVSELSRKCACGGESKVERAKCRKKRLALQRSSASTDDAGLEAPRIVEDVLATSGQPLAHSARRTLESSFGHDFSGVRVHDDSQAAESASAVSALAYTVGNHIVFGSGQYAPGTSDGNHLLAHELTHTIQQTGGTPLSSQTIQQSQQGASSTGALRLERASGDPSAIVHRLTATEKAENLKSPRFAGNTRLEHAFDNNPPMQLGEPSGEPVKIVQQALIDDGFAMPITTKKLGEPDGKFGSETFKTVQGFQSKYRLLENGVADGVVGRHTMGKLDELYANAPAPRKKDPEIEANDKEMGQHVVEGMDHANLDPHTADSGIHYAENYESAFPDRWKDDFRTGFAPPAYWEKLGFMEWRLKAGMSAADGIRAWLNGLTIAECQTTVIAIEWDTLRAAVGDDKFDSRFGASHQVTPEAERIIISPRGKSQVHEFFKSTDAATVGDLGTIGNRPNIKEGEWYYFYNHPKYLLKHPGGAWQGENSIYMGRDAGGQQTWAGLGTFNARTNSTHVTEREMYEEMIEAYNGARDVNDERVLSSIRARNGGKLPPEYVEPKDGGTLFEDRIDENKLLNDPEFTIDGVSRKGGFLLSAGRALDPSKVQGLRNP